MEAKLKAAAPPPTVPAPLRLSAMALDLLANAIKLIYVNKCTIILILNGDDKETSNVHFKVFNCNLVPI